jgi:hypothetical protein
MSFVTSKTDTIVRSPQWEGGHNDNRLHQDSAGITDTRDVKLTETYVDR